MGLRRERSLPPAAPASPCPACYLPGVELERRTEGKVVILIFGCANVHEPWECLLVVAVRHGEWLRRRNVPMAGESSEA